MDPVPTTGPARSNDAAILKNHLKTACFARLHRQRRARILMYFIYTAVLRAALPRAHIKTDGF
jgi:hypothetical protein